MEDLTQPVCSFDTVAARLWDGPASLGGADTAAEDTPAPEETCGVWSSYSFSWLKPFIDLANTESLEEKHFPPPRRRHRAGAIGAQVSKTYRDQELRRRFSWARFTETLPDPDRTSPTTPTTRPLALEAGVRFKGEPQVEGRLRWVGYLSASDDSRRVYAGVEWTSGKLPAYRMLRMREQGFADHSPYTTEAREAAGVHDGCVHGERLFFSLAAASASDALCTCERVEDVELLAGGSGNTAAVDRPRAPSLAKALLFAFKSDLIGTAVPLLFTTLAQALTPLILLQFVYFLESDRSVEGSYSLGFGILVVVLFIVCKTVQPIAWNKYEQRSERTGCAFRTAVLAVIFEKCFTISTTRAALPELSAGRVLTAASTDVNNIRNFGRLSMFVWSAPLELLIYIIMLFYLVGWSALPSFCVFIVCLVLQTSLAHWESRIQAKLSACTDRRMSKTNELLSGIRIVKTMGWEAKFVEYIEDDINARRGELIYRRRLQFCATLIQGIVELVPLLMVLTVFLVHILTGHTLGAQVIFPVIAIFGAAGFPVFMLPLVISTIALFFTSCRRLDQFLEADDQVKTIHTIEDVPRTSSPSSPAYDVFLQGVTVTAHVPHVLPRCTSVLHHRGVSLMYSYLTSLCSAWAAWRGHRVPVELEWREEEVQEERGDTSTTKITMDLGSMSPTPDTSLLGVGEAAHDGADDNRYTLEPKTLLENVQLCIPRGGLTVVVGATGSGKSTLLSTIVGSFAVEKGEAYASRSIAFAPQQAWIMQDTIEANITFFDPHKNPVRIGNAVQCCQLESDLKDLDGGLHAEIGEHGVNLSGGQKARVSLARAVYADRQMYLLDDPLAALDANVGHKILKEVILGALSHKTRILATHHLYALPHADRIVVLEHGRVAFQGDYATYEKSDWRTLLEANYEKEKQEKEQGTGGAVAPGGSDLTQVDMGGEDQGLRDTEETDLLQLAEDFASPTTASSPAAVFAAAVAPSGTGFPTSSRKGATEGRRLLQNEEEGEELSPGQPCRGRSIDGTSDVSSLKTEETGREGQTGQHKGGGSDGKTKCPLKLIEEEEKETGNVPLAVYRRYLEAGGGVGKAVLVECTFFIHRALIAGGDVWLSLWASHYFETLTDMEYLGIYFIIACAVALVCPFRSLVAYQFMRQGGATLHRSLLLSLVSGKISFFDATPMGRVLNRFSKDVYVLDSDFPNEASFFIDIVWSPIISLSVSAFSMPPVVVVVILAMVTFFYLLRFFARVVREVRRRGSIAESPMYSLLGEVLGGRTTIDAYNKAHVLFRVALRRLDRVYACAYFERVVEQWLALRVELLGCGVLLAVVIIGLVERILDQDAHLSPERVSFISLSLTMCMQLFWTLPVTVRQGAMVEAGMNSAQRILHYVDTIEQEELFFPTTDGSTSSSGGGGGTTTEVTVMAAAAGTTDYEDHEGTLELRRVDLRYRPGLPLVLRGVSFIIHRGEKVGVVGRTGSGKSTLLQAFLRLVDICGGEMVVCGRNAAAYTLPALRRLFSLIPQDPVLFQGTVRSNLDPFGACRDDEVAEALRLVGLPVECMALESPVQDGGLNISVGQRQLLCLARALLKKGSQFILLDEATANVDPILDRQVQHVVRESFAAYTVVTIAHRLHTVAGCDRILVMDHGQVVEQGSPRALVQEPSSRFHKLVTQGAIVKRQQRLQQQQQWEEGKGKDGAKSARAATREEEEVDAVVAEAVREFLKDCI